MSVYITHVPHAVYTSTSGWQFAKVYSFLLFTFERPLRRLVLHCRSSPLFTLLTFALESTSLFILSIPIIRLSR